MSEALARMHTPTHTYTHSPGFLGCGLGCGPMARPPGWESSQTESENASGEPLAGTGVSKKQGFSFGGHVRGASL